jgi:hypothetical protein
MTKGKRTEEDKTPSEPIRLKSGTALNLHELGATAMQLARSFDRAERERDQATMGTVGLALIRLATDFGRIGHAITGQSKRRGA